MAEKSDGAAIASQPTPALRDATRVWARIGILSFGGPAAQIALMHRMVVDERRWLSERQFLDALSFCMLLPGPEAMQLATFAGWRMHGVRGGLLAGGLFVLPGAILIAALAALYGRYGDLALVAALFTGIKAAVLVIVVQALVRLSRRALRGPEAVALAGLAFLALFVFAVPYPAVVALAAVWGALRLAAPANTASDSGDAPRGAEVTATLRRVALWLAVWLLPLAAIGLVAPPIFAELARFFATLATVSFGGAYAVLAYMAQEAVTGRGWLTAGEMLDALGLAETTPGPLILVTEFVGYLASARAALVPEHALWWGLAGAIVTLWATFAPCFLWIFAGAPWIDILSRRRRLAAALAGVAAAVVGVIANLSVWFALHVLFTELATLRAGPARLLLPAPATLDPVATGIAVAVAVALFALRWPVAAGIALGAGLGAAAHVLI
ncbi:chromate efflux transporter [Palleronia pelagia]|uniref:Chromate transporter n=1 Tax=Palleronia pelagia TaxID=387096 RepID=A0A1H8DDU1_9RHOB|nr:chromate efflux transporter [Palleronia pelagia]SEN04647.1 chromate transporter [Palleronia pelagia]